MKSMTLLALFGLVALFGPGARGEPKEEKKKAAKVTGTVVFPGKVAFAPGTVVVVSVQDVSLADAKARVLGTQTIKGPKAAPVPFEVAYDPDAIRPRNSYSVSARVTLDGKLLFINDTRIPVITRGGPTRDVKLPVIAIKR